jgi:hypothetical protein
VRVQPTQPFEVVGTAATEPERAAVDDRAIAPGQVEEVRRLHVQHGLAFAGTGRGPAGGDHVGRRVDAIDVEPVGHPGDEQSAAATADVEGGLTGGDVGAEELDLGPVEVEVGPPPSDQPVVPGGRRLLQGWPSRRARNSSAESWPTGSASKSSGVVAVSASGW